MPLGERSAHEQIARGARQSQQAQSVGDSGSAAPNARCHLLLGEAALDEHLIGASLFQRRQVGSLQILDERELENRLW